MLAGCLHRPLYCSCSSSSLMELTLPVATHTDAILFVSIETYLCLRCLVLLHVCQPHELPVHSAEALTRSRFYFERIEVNVLK